MSNKMKLFLIGCTPLIFGVTINILRSVLGMYGSEVLLFGAIFSGCWFYIGYKYNELSTFVNSVVLVHLIGSFCLLITSLLLFSSGSFPFNVLIYLVESYFLPMHLLISVFIPYSGAFSLFFYSLILMIIIFSTGYKMGSEETR